MTAEELIIGHYEKSLTSEQESRLASMVDASPEVRSLYEQHGNIQALMVEEAETIDTSSKLDKVVLGAALGTLAEIAGHGVGFSLFGKVASVVGALVVGGTGIILYNSMTGGDDATPQANPPAVRNAPSASTPAMPTPGAPLSTERTPQAGATESPATSMPTPAATTDARASDADAARSTDAATTARDGRAQNARDRQNSGTSGATTDTAKRTPTVTLGSDGKPTVIQHDPTIPDSGK